MKQELQLRWAMASLGGFGAFGLWHLVKAVEDDRLTGAMAVFLLPLYAGFLLAALAFAGQMRWISTFTRAALAALPPALLLLWATTRFDDPAALFGTPYALLAALLVGMILLPFHLAAAAGPRWNDYATLFERAWGLVIRGLAAFVFAGVFWFVVFLSNALLSLVGISLLGDLIARADVDFFLTGAAAGLAIAVVGGNNFAVSPDLLIRLLRLLSPIVLMVTAVFLLAMPLRGLSDLFGDLSTGTILLAMAAVSATMVSLAVDRDDGQISESRVIRLAARGLSVCVLLLAGLAAWSVWLRIGQYGLTPARLIGMVAALLAMGYGLGYVWALMQRSIWAARVRQTNTAMALALAGVAGLSLTPALNPEALSASSQQKRALDLAAQGEVAELLPLLRWGRAGQAALQELETHTAEWPALAQALTMAPDTISFAPTDETRQQVMTMLPVQPASAKAEKESFVKGLGDSDLMSLHQSCGVALPTGAAGCVLVVADLAPDSLGPEAVLVQRTKGGDTLIEGYARSAEGEGWIWRRVVLQGFQSWQTAEGEKLIERLQASMPATRPVTYRAFDLEGKLMYFPIDE